MVEINQPMMIIRKRLWAEEGQPPNTRYNPDTDTVETTVDGGTTWTPNPGADPRSNPAYLMPPVEGSNAQCAAAFGMVEGIREYVDGIADASNAVVIANLGLNFMLLALAIPVTWMFALALLVAEAINVIGVGIIAAAFTETVYEQLLCIFFEHIDADGRISQEQMDDVLTDVDAEIGDSSVTAVVGLFFSQWGFVGLTNNGFRLQNALADCACGWRAEFPVASAAGIWALLSGGAAGGEYASGWHTTVVFTNGDPARPRKQVYITAAFDSCQVTRIEMYYSATFGVTIASYVAKGFGTNGFGTVIQMTDQQGGSSYIWSGLLTLDDLQMTLGTGASDSGNMNLGDGTITMLAVEGLQPPPAEFVPYLI